jgi:hypothetical protein
MVDRWMQDANAVDRSGETDNNDGCLFVVRFKGGSVVYHFVHTLYIRRTCTCAQGERRLILGLGL